VSHGRILGEGHGSNLACQ